MSTEKYQIFGEGLFEEERQIDKKSQRLPANSFAPRASVLRADDCAWNEFTIDA